nr:PREDICTED: NF-kappa-B-activating protein-like [Bemisia tabaci]
MFAVVEKRESEELDAVPSSWILPSKKEMKYPLLKPSAIWAMAMKGEDIKCAYEVLKIKVIKEPYDSFDVAYDDSRRLMRGLKTRSSSERELKGRGARTKIPKRTFTDAESSSESSSESASKSTSESEEDQNTRRKSRKRKSPKRKSPKRKSKKKSSKRKLSKRKAKLSSSDDHESSSEEEPVTKPSKAEASKAAAKAEVDKHLKRVKDVPPPPAPESIKETNTSEAEIAFLEVDTNGPVDLGTPSKTGSSHSPRINSVKKQLFDTKRSPLKPFESANKHLSHGKLTKIRCKQGKKVKHPCGFRLKCEPEEAILHTLCSISAHTEEIIYRLKKLRHSKGKVEAAKITEAYIPDEIEALLTIDTEEKLEKLEDKLKLKEGTIKDEVVKGFAWMHRNDSNLTATARGMARELFSNKILALFSLHGGHAKGSAETKRAFDQLQAYSVIIEVVKLLWENHHTNFKADVNGTLGPFLTGMNKKPVSLKPPSKK